ncbi:hypothetical protein KP509_12G033400 [Ceratopteris richardii]|uniref:Uncharacterized protein n=1 Tax=Ceratopteris richardii TaxID=49495 RepID=A0A8T2TNF8_CERRI|nr:hypothetical protein KP509_12G033400 [Ceratopteris richardii]
MAPDPSDPFVFASIQFLIHKQQQRKTSRYSRFGSSSSSRLFPSTISANGTVRHTKRKNRICSCADPRRIYLKPGALAQLRDAHKNCRLTPLAIFSPKKKKKISSSINDSNSFETTDVEISQVRLPRGDEDRNDAQFMDIPSFTPGPSIRMFGPLCPQRKKLLAPKNPLHHPTVINAAASVPIMPDNFLPVSPDPERVSLLESLPLELLVS